MRFAFAEGSLCDPHVVLQLSDFVAQETTEHALQGKVHGDDGRYTGDSLPAAEFQLERHINVAIKMLALDPNLAKIHSRLISHMPEQTFWFHYFSRVAALRTETGLEPLCEDLRKVRAPGTPQSLHIAVQKSASHLRWRFRRYRCLQTVICTICLFYVVLDGKPHAPSFFAWF